MSRVALKKNHEVRKRCQACRNGKVCGTPVVLSDHSGVFFSGVHKLVQMPDGKIGCKGWCPQCRYPYEVADITQFLPKPTGQCI